jgi:DNA-binding NtrC family response regulator
MSESGKIAARIIIVDDDEVILRMLSEFLHDEGHDVASAARGALAVAQVEYSRFDIMLLDLMMPTMDGMEVLRRVRAIDDSLSVIIMTGNGTMESAIKAMVMGAEDYLLKPLQMDILRLAVSRTMAHRQLRIANTLLREDAAVFSGSHEIVAGSKLMRDVVDLAAKIAPLRSTVLIQGESGTGKELLARALHDGGTRAALPFVAVNCAVIPLTLLESELFGHERGAFTGADSRRMGFFEAAAGGTIFLDEISETPLDFQAKLLRVLQERTFRRVGGAAELKADARVIVSTNRNLQEEVRAGRFRADLYYRLNVILLRVPPLRERPEDILLLAHHFLSRYEREFSKPHRGMSAELMEWLLRHPWPGNVRELENVIQRAVAVAEGDSIGMSDLLEPLPAVPASFPSHPGEKVRPYAQARDDFDRGYLKSLMAASAGSVTEASRLAGIARQNLYKKLRKLSIDSSSPSP